MNPNSSLPDFRHPGERFYGTMMTIIGSIFWLVILLFLLAAALMDGAAAVVVVLFYTLGIYIFSVAARALMRAYMLGHHVRVGPSQFPHLHRMVDEGARALGLRQTPEAFVYNSHGVTNAFALTLIGRTRYIWLTSGLIDVENDEQLRFVIGHELGHHVLGHLDQPWTFLKAPAHLVPFLGAAYSRARELSCDRVGAFLAGKSSVSCTALQMLACGSARLNAQLNPGAYAEQNASIPPVAGFVLTIFSHYPSLTRRVQAVKEWHAQGFVPPRPHPDEQGRPLQGAA